MPRPTSGRFHQNPKLTRGLYDTLLNSGQVCPVQAAIVHAKKPVVLPDLVAARYMKNCCQIDLRNPLSPICSRSSLWSRRRRHSELIVDQCRRSTNKSFAAVHESESDPEPKSRDICYSVANGGKVDLTRTPCFDSD
jgi:hypothetical protein